MADDLQNPANEPRLKITDENRMPMGAPELMLGVPKTDGHEMYWFADRPGRIPRAMAAGWEFVKRGEIQLSNFGFASDVLEDGNTDLGTNVSVHGGTSEKGGSERLYLMKIKKEWYDKDMALREEVSERTARSFLAGTLGSDKDSPGDSQHRYVKSAEMAAMQQARKTDNPFTRNKRRP